jgi:hypothetical protein
MVQFEVFRPGKESTMIPVAELPFRIGRGAQCDLRLSGPGIWEEHAQVTLAEDASFSMARRGEGSLTINGDADNDGRICNGDTIELGSTKLRFWMTPIRPRSQAIGDWIFWLLVGGVLISMIALILGLPR